MATDPALVEPRITLEVLAELRRARIVRRRWLIAIAVASAIATVFATRRVARHFFAAEWLEANSISVDWQVDAETWRQGGVTSVRARPFNYFGAGNPDHTELASLANLHRVEELDLANYNGLQDSDLECLAGLTELRSLNLDQTHDEWSRRPGPVGLSDTTLARLAGLRHLRELSLGKSRISDAGMVHLSELSDLETLDLTETAITDAGLEPLKRLKRLKSLTLTTTRVTPEGVRAFQTAMPSVVVTHDPGSP